MPRFLHKLRLLPIAQIPLLTLLPHRTNGPRKERGPWLEDVGRKVQCTYARARQCRMHGGADTWKPSKPKQVHDGFSGMCGDARQYTKPLAKRALRDYVDRANEYQPLAVKTQMMGKASTPFSVFAARWQTEVLVHKKASTAATIKGHISRLLIPVFGNLAIGDLDSERVQSFLNRSWATQARRR